MRLDCPFKNAHIGSDSHVGHHSRRILVIVETRSRAFAASLRGLLINSFFRMNAVDPGFTKEHVLVGEFDLPDTHYKEPQQRRNFVHELMERVSPFPGVGSVGATETLPLHPGDQFWVGFERQGHPVPSWERMPVVAFAHVTPGYFSAMRISILPRTNHHCRVCRWLARSSRPEYE